MNVKSASEATKGGQSASVVSGMLREDRNIEETLEVNDMLVDAIKAKLAILDNI